MLTLANSDPNLIRVYMRFLRDACGVSDERITLRINGYLGNGIEREDIIAYWLDITKLSPSNLRSCTFNIHSNMSTHRKKNLIYGTAHLIVCSVELVQRVYGAISEIAGVEEALFLG